MRINRLKLLNFRNHEETKIEFAAHINLITGPNGSGKTSLLRAIIGAVKPSQGHVIQRNEVKIGYVPQKLHIDETLPITVSRFLKLPGGVAVADIDHALAQ